MAVHFEPPTATVHLVRHGQTTWNAERRIQGQSVPVPLNHLGELEVRAAAEQLVGLPACRVVTSDLHRARQSASLIAARLGLAVEIDPLWREQHLGELEGRTFTDAFGSGTVADEIDRMWSDPDQRPPGGGGESLRQLYGRIRLALEALADRHRSGDVIVVTHGGAVRAAAAVLAGEPPERMSRTTVDNASITSLPLRNNSHVNVRSGRPTEVDR